MKKIFALVVLMLLPLGASAQSQVVAFVNVNEVVMAMPELGQMETKLAELNEQYKKELETMQAEYQKKYSAFVEQQDSLPENIKLRRMQEVEDLRQRTENLLQVAREDVNKTQMKLYQPIQDKVQAAIKKVGEENGYAYILDSQVCLYTGTSSVDATPKVKAKLGIK